MPEVSLGTYAKTHGLPYNKLHALCVDEGIPSAVLRNGIWFVDEEEIPPDVTSNSRKFLATISAPIQELLRVYCKDTGLAKTEVIRWALIRHLKEEGYVLSNSTKPGLVDSETTGGSEGSNTTCGASLGCGGTAFKPRRKGKA